VLAASYWLGRETLKEEGHPRVMMKEGSKGGIDFSSRSWRVGVFFMDSLSHKSLSLHFVEESCLEAD
jgi:hypothetical protein